MCVGFWLFRAIQGPVDSIPGSRSSERKFDCARAPAGGRANCRVSKIVQILSECWARWFHDRLSVALNIDNKPIYLPLRPSIQIAHSANHSP